MPPAESWRLFVALVVPDAVKAGIERAQSKLRAAVPKGSLRWTRRDQLHLTLRFLGDVEAGRLDALRSSLNAACDRFPPLRLRARGIGFFPAAGLPRVVWAGADDEDGRLTQLHLAVETAVGDFVGVKPEGEFTGHVTLGRAREIGLRNAEALRKAAESMATRWFGEWTADHLELIRSEVTSSGSRYTRLAVVRLANGPGVR